MNRQQQLSLDAIDWFQRNNYETDYLQKRGFSQVSIQVFGLGFYPKEKNLKRFLNEKGYRNEEISAAGLLRRKDDGTFSQFLYGRVIFPIYSSQGLVTGFAGRAICEEDCKYGKYINSPESQIFQKRKNLYGIHDMPQSETVFIVEGYVDCIALHQAGIRNSVACMGTAVTADQIALLKNKKVKKVIFCLDSDEAGQKAMKRSLPALKKEFDVSVMGMSEGKDPDEFLRKHSSWEFFQNKIVPWEAFMAGTSSMDELIDALF